MKKIILLITIICFQLSTFSQVINGTIFDKNTDEKVLYAAIYFNGTFVGTTSNANGNFKLDVSKNSSMPLTISCMGYYSHTLNDYTTDKPLIIYLKPKAFEVNEVVVSAKSLAKKRKANLKLFKSIFLGSSLNAESCDIINEKDITFNYGSDHDTLKAFALKPIIIKNKALGYNITYYLDKFEYNKKSRDFIYKGNSIFNEDLITNETNKQLYEEERIKTYLGSRMHFFRALWTNNFISSGFQVKDLENIELNHNNIVIQAIVNIQDSINQFSKYISYPTNLSIHYNSKLSTMRFLNQRVYFDYTGYHSLGIFWEGEMSKKRIGDSLPYEYKPKLIIQ